MYTAATKIRGYMEPSTLDLAQLIAGAAAALIALAIFAQKFLNTWQSNKAENSVINLMHTELERMSEQNAHLSEELGKLQQEIIKLNRQLRELTQENQKLHAEVATLTVELNKLYAALQGGQNGSSS